MARNNSQKDMREKSKRRETYNSNVRKLLSALLCEYACKRNQIAEINLDENT